MLPTFRYLLVLCAVIAAGAPCAHSADSGSTAAPDSVADLNLNDLKQRVEQEERRKRRLFEQARREREMLQVVQQATLKLMDHYRTLRDLKEKHLTVAVLDSPTVVATAAAAAQIKKAQQVILSAADPQQVQVALDVTDQTVRNLERVFAARKDREKVLLAEAPVVPVEDLRVRAIETIRDLKKGLNGRIKAESGANKLMIRNLGTLKADLMKIDTGIRQIEKAGSAERVGEVLAGAGLNSGQLKLIERELDVKKERGRAVVSPEAKRDPVAFKQRALALMQGMRSSVSEKIKAEYAGSRNEIGRLERLQAKLKRVDSGLTEVEKAGTGQRLGRVLAEIQLDLGSIDRLRTGVIPEPPQPAVKAASGTERTAAARTAERPAARASEAPASGSQNIGNSEVVAVKEDTGLSLNPAKTMMLHDDSTAGVDTVLSAAGLLPLAPRFIILALIVLAALLTAVIISVRRLHVRN